MIYNWYAVFWKSAVNIFLFLAVVTKSHIVIILSQSFEVCISVLNIGINDFNLKSNSQHVHFLLFSPFIKITCLIYSCLYNETFLFAFSEWAVNIQRDSYASYVGHYPMLGYFAIAENESIGRERYNFMQVFLSFSINYNLGSILCSPLF